LEYKLNTINKKIQKKTVVNYYSDDIPVTQNANNEIDNNIKGRKLSRPILKYSIPRKNASFILRNLDEDQ
jgi:hypothetical protein